MHANPSRPATKPQINLLKSLSLAKLHCMASMKRTVRTQPTVSDYAL